MNSKSQRIEEKFLVNAKQYSIVLGLASQYMVKDKNVEKNGLAYSVHSLYFDNFEMSSYRDSNDGCESRQKFRMRFYNQNSETTFLETKSKRGEVVAKERQRLDIKPDHLLSMMKNGGGELIPELKRAGYEASDFVSQFYRQQLRPTCWISYSREAFSVPFIGGARLTIDSDIKCRAYRLSDSARAPGKSMESIRADGHRLVELKYSTMLPTWLRHLQEELNSTKTSFSKYAKAVEIGSIREMLSLATNSQVGMNYGFSKSESY